jgi:hypothetical protein
VRFKI